MHVHFLILIFTSIILSYHWMKDQTSRLLVRAHLGYTTIEWSWCYGLRFTPKTTVIFADSTSTHWHRFFSVSDALAHDEAWAFRSTDGLSHQFHVIDSNLPIISHEHGTSYMRDSCNYTWFFQNTLSSLYSLSLFIVSHTYTNTRTDTRWAYNRQKRTDNPKVWLTYALSLMC